MDALAANVELKSSAFEIRKIKGVLFLELGSTEKAKSHNKNAGI